MSTAIQPIQYTPEQLKHVTRAPAGDCPIKFSLFSELEGAAPFDTAIISWFWEVREYGLRRGVFYTAEAIARWAGTEFDEFGDVYPDITDTIYRYAIAIGDHAAPKLEDIA